MALKDLVRGRKSSSIIYPLEQYLNNIPNEGRVQDVFHPSEISKSTFCPRAWCLRLMYPQSPEKLNADSIMIFDVGHLIHHLMKIYYGDAGLLFGKYRCLKCGYKHIGFKPATNGIPPQCPECGAEDLYSSIDKIEGRNWWYIEPKVSYPELRISGHTDMVLIYEGKKFVGEVKSINDRGYGNLTSPIADHQEQGLLYLGCLQNELSHSNIDTSTELGRLTALPYEGLWNIYINKNDQKKRKAFYTPNDIRVVQTMDRVTERVMPALNWFNKTADLPCRTCQSEADAKAMGCKIPFSICRGENNSNNIQMGETRS